MKGEFMEYEEELEQINIQNAIKCMVKTSLNDIFELLTKNSMAALASTYDIKGRSKMKKEELVSNVFKCITATENLERNLLVATSEEWEVFETLFDNSLVQNNKLSFGYYAYLKEKGLIYSFYNGGNIYFVMPNEVKEAYQRIDKDAFLKARHRYQIILKYILAMTNLYGAFKPEKLIEIFNIQNDNKLTEDEFTEIYQGVTAKQQAFSIYEDYIISDYFEYDEMDEFEELLYNTKDKPYYIPGKNEFLKYSDDLYFEMTPQLIELKKFVLKDMCKDEELVDSLIDDIQLACSMEDSMDEIKYEFERRNINFKSMSQLKNLISLIIEVNNNTRIWSNHGYTPIEMHNLIGRSKLRDISVPIMINANKQICAEKIGRNDPCPCGSGKKYKKCCGK